MVSIRHTETLTIMTQNVIPELTYTPLNNVVMMITAGAPAIPNLEFTVSGKTITWDSITAGYDLEVGNSIIVDYDYDDGSEITPPYDSSNSRMNPSLITYSMTVIETNIFPKLIHNPSVSTLVIKVNNVEVYKDVDWTVNRKIVTWISLTNLDVGSIVNVQYRVGV